MFIICPGRVLIGIVDLPSILFQDLFVVATQSLVAKSKEKKEKSLLCASISISPLQVVFYICTSSV